MRRLALFSLGFLLATVFCVYIFTDIRTLWLAGGCLILSALCIYFCIGRCGCILLGAAAAMLWCFAYGQIFLALADRAAGSEQYVSVQIADLPQESAYGAKVTVHLPLEGRNYRAVLFGEEALLNVRPGDTVRCVVQMKKLAHTEEGAVFFPDSDGTVLRLIARSVPQVEGGTPSLPMRLRLWLQTRIKALYSSEHSPLLLALLTGDSRELSYSVRNDLSVAGLSHAVAVSGLHVSVLLAAITLLCGYNPRLTALVGIPAVVLFSLMAGSSPSALRSAVMQVIMLLAPLARRESDPPTNLATAALVLLLQNPLAVTDVSFQLSFAAVGGLLIFSSPLQKKLLCLRRKPGRLWKAMAATVAATLSATVTTLPLTVFYFGLISICAPLSNLLVLWAMSAILVLGLFSCLPYVGIILVWPVRILCEYALGFARLVASFPYAAAYPDNLSLMIWAALTLCAVIFSLLRRKKGSGLLSVSLTAALIFSLLFGRWSLVGNPPVFRFLDVGQGQCVLMQTKSFSAILDCGSSSPEKAGELVARTLHSGGQTYVDAVLLTHYDSDHAGGIPHLLRRIKVGTVILPDIPDDSGMRQRIEEAAYAAGTEVLAVSTLTEVVFADGKLMVFPPLSLENDNNAGICVLASAGKYDMLITGDLDQFAEMRLLSNFRLPQVEILAAGHHGSKTSTSSTLLNAVCPEIIVISVGENNFYGHPSEETLERITATGAAVYRTDTDGTIIIRGR